MSLQVERIPDRPALEALRPEWHALWRATPGSTPFQSPDWLIPWWRHVGRGELLSFAFRSPEGALVGFAPLYVYAEPPEPRRLFPLGIATSDYLDGLALPAARTAVAASLAERLAVDADRFDVIEWPQLRAGALLREVEAIAGFAGTTGAAEPCPILRFDGVATLAEAVPVETLESLVRRRARAGKKGRVTFESARPDNAAALLEAHLRLHAARWAERGEAGVLAETAVQACHREALPDLLRSGALRLHAMLLDGRVVATLQGFADPDGRAERQAYFYLGGFDPAVERLSPGMLVVGFAIEEAFRDGLAGVDFLRGQEAHKYQWGAQDVATFRRTFRRAPGGPA